MVTFLGINKALWMARGLHVLTLFFLVIFGLKASLAFPYFLSLILVAGLLLYEHSLVSANDLSRINAAFFNVNGIISLIYLAGIILSLSN